MVTNETDTTISAAPSAGASLSMTRVLSGADLALFALLAGQLDLRGEVQLSLESTSHQPVSQALLASLLTSAAIRFTGQSDFARVSNATLRFSEQAYSDEPLRISATYDPQDPTSAMRVAINLHSGDGRLLASGDILIQPS